MSNKRPLVALAVLVLACVLAPAGVRCAGDPWYEDMRNHWAEPYVRVLWEESVTDGYIPRTNPSTARFWPEEYCTRAQLAALLFKVFGLQPAYPKNPTYPDVPKDYSLFWNKPAWHFIEGAHAGGITLAAAGSYFRPDSFIDREDSVELLIRSLGLSAYASSLSASEQKSILSRFWDHAHVAYVRRPSMACAVKLGIIKGYEDGSLRPSARLARGEAATIVARSCMIRMAAREESFSPDGDGVNDLAVFDLAYLKNRGITSWQAVIENSSGAPIRHLGPPGSPGQPPASLTWDGKANDGKVVPSGTYHYQALVTDASGRQHTSVRRPIVLTRRSLTAWLRPSSCRDWSTLTVSASTEPAALLVTATFADGIKRPMTDLASATHWQESVLVGPPLPEGPQDVVVSAWFHDASRTTTLRFTRVVDLWLDPSIAPNPATWGQSLTLECRTPSVVRSVRATLFDATIDMAKRDGTTWEGSAEVPWGATPGEYPVGFTATSASSSEQATLVLTVSGPDTAGLAYVLTK